MTNLIDFPGLGLHLELSRVAFSIFGIDVYWYGVLIAAGLILAVLFGFSQCNRFGIDSDRMIDVILVGFVCAIVGGRLYYVIFSGYDYNSFLQVIDLRSGGIAIYGAILFAFAGAAVTCKVRKVPLLPMFDVASMGFLIGQSIGRWGNFFNQEAFGRNTTLPWGMISPTTTGYLTRYQAQLAESGVMVDPNLPVHPTFLYESLWCALGFLLLFLYRKHRRFNGEIALFYAMWYGFGRFFIEGLRTDSLMVGTSARVSQVLAAVLFLGALAAWIFARIKTKGKPLVVPEIPPHTAEILVMTADGEKTVTVSWPANTREPSDEEKEHMAQDILKKQETETETDGVPTPNDKAKEATAQAKEKPVAKTTAKAKTAADTGKEPAAKQDDAENQPAAKKPAEGKPAGESPAAKGKETPVPPAEKEAPQATDAKKEKTDVGETD